jgi:hypothetical protein
LAVKRPQNRSGEARDGRESGQKKPFLAKVLFSSHFTHSENDFLHSENHFLSEESHFQSDGSHFLSDENDSDSDANGFPNGENDFPSDANRFLSSSGDFLSGKNPSVRPPKTAHHSVTFRAGRCPRINGISSRHRSTRE